MVMNSAAQNLLRFVNEELLAGSERRAGVDTPLFEDGWIDSLKILHLIAFVEIESGRRIPDEMIVMDRFRTVGEIARNFLETWLP
jgi:acyl carrier protein